MKLLRPHDRPTSFDLLMDGVGIILTFFTVIGLLALFGRAIVHLA